MFFLDLMALEDLEALEALDTLDTLDFLEYLDGDYTLSLSLILGGEALGAIGPAVVLVDAYQVGQAGLEVGEVLQVGLEPLQLSEGSHAGQYLILDLGLASDIFSPNVCLSTDDVVAGSGGQIGSNWLKVIDHL